MKRMLAAVVWVYFWVFAAAGFLTLITGGSWTAFWIITGIIVGATLLGLVIVAGLWMITTAGEPR